MLNSPPSKPALQNKAETTIFWFLLCLFVLPAIFSDVIAGFIPFAFYAGYALIVAVVVAPFLRTAPQKSRRNGLTLSLSLMLIIVAMPWNSRKAFVRDLYSVRPGMTVRQVEAIMGRYNEYCIQPNTILSPDGELALVDPNIASYRHSEEPAFNGDIGVVHFQNGRVVRVEFLPD